MSNQARRLSELKIRSMIKYMTADQKRTFSLNLYKNIYRDVEKLNFSNKNFIKTKVREHFTENKNLEAGSLEQLRAIERGSYFYRSKLGGLM